MTHVLDTDHLSLLQRRQGRDSLAVAARYAVTDPGDVVLGIPSLHEQALGAHAYINRAKTMAEAVRGYAMLHRVLHDFSEIGALPFDDAAAVVFADLVARRVRIGTMDLRIASIALANKLILATRNTLDFSQVPGLVTEDWTA